MSAKQHKIELQAQTRTILGSGMGALRHTGVIPAVLYGKDQEALSIQVSLKDFRKTLKLAGESTLVYVTVDGESYPTIINDVARDHSDDIIHADFYKVNLKEKITAKVPVVYAGESPAVKSLGGIFIRNINELEVEALPINMPHEITVDISILENFGDHVLLKNVSAGKDVLIMGNPEEILATVQEPISEEALQASLETTATVDDVEIVEKEKKVEIVDDEAPVAEEK